MKIAYLFMFMASAFLSFGSVTGVMAKEAAEYLNLSAPTGLIYDKNGDLYVSEWGSGKVTVIEPDGTRKLLTDAIKNPAGLAIDDQGTLYIAGYGDGKIYRYRKNEGLSQLSAGFASPTGILWDGSGLLVANRNSGEIVRVYPDGRNETVSRDHAIPVGIAKVKYGTMFVSCYGGCLDIISSDGKRKKISRGLTTPGVGIIPDGQDSVIVVDYGAGSLAHVNSKGEVKTFYKNLLSPVALARAPKGKIIVGCWGDNAIHSLNNNQVER